VAGDLEAVAGGDEVVIHQEVGLIPEPGAERIDLDFELPKPAGDRLRVAGIEELVMSRQRGVRG
jgi:hypothetical protein